MKLPMTPAAALAAVPRSRFAVATSIGPRIVIASLLAVVLSGCGRGPAETPESPSTPSASESTDPQAADDEAISFAPPTAVVADPAAQVGPPGTIELPADFDPTKIVSPTASGGAVVDPIRNGRGFELPPSDDASPDDSSSLTKGQPGSAKLTSMPAPGDTASGPGVAADSGDESSDVQLTTATWEEISATVSKTGQITVVDVWSLACEPCLKEFPGLVKLDRELGDQIACFAVDADFDGRRTKPAESYRPRVEAFLKSVDAEFPNYLSSTASDELFAAIGIDSIPAVLIYDASGKLIRKFSDVGDDAGFTYHDNIVPFVKKLLEN